MATIPVVLSKKYKSNCSISTFSQRIRSQHNFSLYVLHVQELNECPNQARNVNNHNLRKDNDFFMLSQSSPPNLSKTQGAFSYYGPSVWNNLPYSIRCQNNIVAFKSQLKTHFFQLAYKE